MDQMDGGPEQEHEGELTRLLRNLRNVISDNLASNQYEGGVEVFSVQRRMASARSFNMLQSMLHLVLID